MKNRKKYSAEFKLQVVKEYLNTEKSLNDIANEYSIPSAHTIHKWVKKYEDSGYDDNVFNSKKGRPEHAAQAVCSFFFL
ncbi:MAG: hypothetical protein B6I29_00905 [Marinitoga sp. 4572_148]|nr:MAG: hypothetical protein B6I29_00905 [Marinitoga sp. 4572_148]